MATKQILVSLEVSGDISDDNDNTIYDYNNSYIPDSIIQQSNLDADTVDGMDASELGGGGGGIVSKLVAEGTTKSIEDGQSLVLAGDAKVEGLMEIQGEVNII